MVPSSEHVAASPAVPHGGVDFRLVVSVLLLAVAAVFTWRTIDALSSRRMLRMELAEISHVRYGMLNVDQWMKAIIPILDARIDTLDLKASSANLRPTIESALYRLLENVKERMTAPTPPKPGQPAAGGGFLGGGNALMANLMIGALKPHVPEYANVVLAELGRPQTRDAVKKYIRSVLSDGAQKTFGNVDMKWHSYILQHYGCADARACQQELGNRIGAWDAKIATYFPTVLASSALAFLLLLTGRPVLRRSDTVVLMLFCIILLAGGVLTPMLEVEAKITHMGLTFLGEPIAFNDQVVYFQSKSVLEVFRTLIAAGRPDMYVVGILVLMFSIVFPTLKVLTLALCLHRPALLRRSRIAKFFALDASKWSMADVMALAIFMSFVAFNGLVANTMSGLRQTGADLSIPTDSSKILAGYHLFIGFCLASIFLSKKLERGIQTTQAAGHD